MLDHVAQLAPVIAANADVIAVWQAGFIGYWGEWYYTDTYGAPGAWTGDDLSNRQALVTAMLDALPADRQVQLRTLEYKKLMATISEPLSSASCFDGSPAARIGHFNDCFLASDKDFGTYTDPASDYPWLAADTSCVAMGGETCNPNPPRSECPTALDELALFHWSYLNSQYHPEVLDGWQTDGCMEEIQRRLGYRLRLVSGSAPSQVTPGRSFPVTLAITNDGFAAPFNPRGLALVLRHIDSGALWSAPLEADPRTWTPAVAEHLVQQTVGLGPDMPLGQYALLLHLPDPMPALSDRPEYAIRLANPNSWEADTGANALGHTVELVATPLGGAYTGTAWFEAAPTP